VSSGTPSQIYVTVPAVLDLTILEEPDGTLIPTIHAIQIVNLPPLFHTKEPNISNVRVN
jgi:hypothetical protein